MTKTIVISKDDVLMVQKAQYQMNSRMNLIHYLIEQHTDAENTIFKKYNQEYQEFFEEYDKAKNFIETTYVRTEIENPIRWDLNFNTCELTIEY